MAFYDRFSYFITPFSGSLQRHLKWEQPKTMDVVYNTAMEWTNVEMSMPGPSSTTNRRSYTSSRASKHPSSSQWAYSTRSYSKQKQTTTYAGLQTSRAYFFDSRPRRAESEHANLQSEQAELSARDSELRPRIAPCCSAGLSWSQLV